MGIKFMGKGLTSENKVCLVQNLEKRFQYGQTLTDSYYMYFFYKFQMRKPKYSFTFVFLLFASIWIWKPYIGEIGIVML